MNLSTISLPTKYSHVLQIDLKSSLFSFHSLHHMIAKLVPSIFPNCTPPCLLPCDVVSNSTPPPYLTAFAKGAWNKSPRGSRQFSVMVIWVSMTYPCEVRHIGVWWLVEQRWSHKKHPKGKKKKKKNPTTPLIIYILKIR